jgi:hypothetical protein
MKLDPSIRVTFTLPRPAPLKRGNIKEQLIPTGKMGEARIEEVGSVFSLEGQRNSWAEWGQGEGKSIRNGDGISKSLKCKVMF